MQAKSQMRDSLLLKMSVLVEFIQGRKLEKVRCPQMTFIFVEGLIFLLCMIVAK